MNNKNVFIRGDFWDMHVYGSYLYLIDSDKYLLRIKVQDIENKAYGNSLNIFQGNEHSEITYDDLYKENKAIKIWKFERSVIDLKFYYNNLYYIDSQGLYKFKLFGNNLEKNYNKNISNLLIKGYFTDIEIQNKVLFVSSMSRGTYMIDLMSDNYPSDRISENYYSSLVSSNYGLIMNSYFNNSMINIGKQKKMSDALEKDIFYSKGYIVFGNDTFYKFYDGFLQSFHIKKNTIQHSVLNVDNKETLIRMHHIDDSLVLEFNEELLIYSNGDISKRIDLDNKFVDWKIYPESVKYRNQLHILENDGLLIKYVNFSNVEAKNK